MIQYQKYEHRVRALEALGNRGSATVYEHRAADYLVNELQEIGLQAAKEPFNGSTSWGSRLLVHVAVAVIGACLLWSKPTLTVIFASVALVSLCAEDTTRFIGLGRLLRRPISYNVVARSVPKEARRRLILCAHYDTQRTGWIWTVARLLTPISRSLPVVIKPPMLSLVLAGLVQIVAGVLAIRSGASFAVNSAGSLLLFVYVIYALLLGNWAAGPFVPGAADNGSGVAAVLALSEEWYALPAEDVELVVLLTGCEESGLLGAAAWLDRHKAEVQELPTFFLNVDGIGFGPARFLGWEVPVFGLPKRYPTDMIKAAGRIAVDLNLADAGPHALPGPTDGLAFLARGIPGVTIIGFRDGKVLPHYHEMQDTSDNMDFDSARTGVEFARALMEQLSGTLE